MTERTPMRRLAIASMVGTTLEWYDFALYNAMAGLVFNKIFFPTFDPLAGTLLAFSTYAVGYFARPIGGIVCGRLGDLIGRRAVLVWTLALMGATSAFMAFLPGYDVLGPASAVLLVLLRFVQGIALGGEWAGAVLLSLEHGRADQRGLNASWAQCGPSAGTLLATAALGITTYLTTNAEFVAWGWRVPFLASLVLVAFGLWIRSGVDETPQFKALEARGQKADTPVREVLKHHWRQLLVGIGVKFGPDLVYNLTVTFSLTYVTQVLLMSRSTALTAVWVAAAVNVVAIPFFGSLSDRFGRRSIYAVAVVLAIVWSFIFFPLMNTKVPLVIGLAIVLGLICHAAMYGPQGSLITELFETRVRYTGSSLAYTFAGFVSGSTPAILVVLLQRFHGTLALSAYATFLLALTGLALFAAGRLGHKREQLPDPLPTAA